MSAIEYRRRLPSSAQDAKKSPALNTTEFTYIKAKPRQEIINKAGNNLQDRKEQNTKRYLELHHSAIGT